MKPRIVILSAFLSPFRSGAEAMAEETAVRLRPTHDITIVTARLRRSLPKEDMLHGTVPVVRVGLGIPLDKWLFPFLAPFAARRLQPQIVHGVLETFAGAALVLCRYACPDAKRLLTLQTTNRRLFSRTIHRSPHALTAISGVLVRRARRYGRRDVTLIPNGIDTAAIDAACASTTRNPRRILFVGRLERMKGIDTLLRAFKIVLPSVPDATLRIVGDGSRRASLERLARELHIHHRVEFAGYVPVPAMYAEYAAARIFCGLSRSEAFGNVFIEAQTAGCAVVATRVGGIPDIVEHEETGLLVEPDDPNAAAQALRRLLLHESTCEALIKQGRARSASFDWQAISERYAKAYARLLS